MSKHWKWSCTILGVVVTALTFICIQPALKSVRLAEEANKIGTESNKLAAENNKLARWSALLSCKQDCESRAVCMSYPDDFENVVADALTETDKAARFEL